MTANLPTPEFSRPFPVDRLGATPVTETITATAQECAALAKRFRLPAVSSLSAAVRFERQAGGLIHVSGHLEAEVVQTCVVTLVDFPGTVMDSFSLDFGDTPGDFEDDISVDPDYDPPEPIEAGAIDAGELVAQYLSLALDQHPRAPGATLDSALTDPDPDALSPFAVLKKLKQPS